ncbi:MAG: hypothetical protein QW569_04650 [Candidatus Bathyarchaeia archaeon]|nr:hypothetical protein [Candidatus Bathyarchaeota archaeon]
MSVRKLRGTVLNVERTGESKIDEDGLRWDRCVFTVRIEGFSKRTPDERLPPGLAGKEVKVVRWCCFDWHYKVGVKKTLEPDETEAVLEGKPTPTVYW